MTGSLWIALTIALGIVAHALFFVVVPEIAESKGIPSRYFERSVSYPALREGTEEERKEASKTNQPPLREFAQFRESEAKAYVWPVLFPLDLIMMAFLAMFLAVGSVTFGAYVPWAADRTWLILALPIAYFAIDLAEDSWLAWLLTNPAGITYGRVGFLKTLTVAKFVSLGLAYVQCILLFGLALRAWSRPA
jgi:hypothetical protein